LLSFLASFSCFDEVLVLASRTFLLPSLLTSELQLLMTAFSILLLFSFQGPVSPNATFVIISLFLCCGQEPFTGSVHQRLLYHNTLQPIRSICFFWLLYQFIRQRHSDIHKYSMCPLTVSSTIKIIKTFLPSYSHLNRGHSSDPKIIPIGDIPPTLK
jgi:hypothetical protein